MRIVRALFLVVACCTVLLLGRLALFDNATSGALQAVRALRLAPQAQRSPSVNLTRRTAEQPVIHSSTQVPADESLGRSATEAMDEVSRWFAQNGGMRFRRASASATAPRRPGDMVGRVLPFPLHPRVDSLRRSRPEACPPVVNLCLREQDVQFGNKTSAVGTISASLVEAGFTVRPSCDWRGSRAAVVYDDGAQNATAFACAFAALEGVFVFATGNLDLKRTAEVQEALNVCAPRLVLLWHRSATDGRPAPPSRRAELEPKDGRELAGELGLIFGECQLKARPLPDRCATLGQHSAPCIDRIQVRTRYDPAWVALRSQKDGVAVRVDVKHRCVNTAPAVRDLLSADVDSFDVVSESGTHFYRHRCTTEGASPRRLNRIDVTAKQAVVFHYPWVRDNVYHTHNDNLLPLLLVVLQQGVLPSDVHLVVLPTTRSEVPLPVFEFIARRMFGNVTFLDPLAAPTVDVDLHPGARFVWGRPPRLFSAEPWVALTYQRMQVLPMFRKLLIQSKIATPESSARMWQPNAVRVLWLHRSTKRRLKNDGTVIERFLLAGGRSVDIRFCCETVRYSEQVEMAGSADIMIGVHGAGLLHAIHADLPGFRTGRPPPVVVHIASRRLNFHEQVIIERLVLLHRSAKFISTRTQTMATDRDASWQTSFSIPDLEARRIADLALSTFLVG